MQESEASKRLKRYLKIIQEDAKLEVLILRAHLLIEEELRTLIDLSNKYPEKFNHRQFGFNQCLTLVLSNYGSSEKEWLWKSIKIINEVRNIMAHKINPHHDEKINNKLDELDILIEQNAGVPMPGNLKPSVRRIHWQLSSLYSALASLKENVSKHSSA